jgi:uncharacterized alkaline shock family protein YloU
LYPNPDQSQVNQDGGLLTISRKVVKHTIQRIALGVPDVLQLGGDSIWKRLLRWLGFRLGPRGIWLELGDGEAAMTLTIVMRHGARVPQVTAELRRRVQRGLKEELGIEVRTVNVHVASVKAGARIGAFEEAEAREPLGLPEPPPRDPKRRFDL